MHPTAMKNCESFFASYSRFFEGKNISVVDIGSQDVNGSLKQVCPDDFSYTGVDFEKAKGVDIVLEDPYVLPFEDESVDIVLSSSCFEHSEMFWLSFLEILRILKPSGLFYLNAPSDGEVHRYPVDCWRFYPDSGQALVTWGKRNGFNPKLLENYTQIGGRWNDYVAIFLKDSSNESKFNERILNHKKDFENGSISHSKKILNPSKLTQNQKSLRLRSLKGLLRNLESSIRNRLKRK